MAAVFFDWIFVAVVRPWPILALLVAFTSRPPTDADRKERFIQVGRGINREYQKAARGDADGPGVRSSFAGIR